MPTFNYWTKTDYSYPDIILVGKILTLKLELPLSIRSIPACHQ